MRVDIEDVLRIRRERNEINKLDLTNIEWYKDGVKVEAPEADIAEFLFTGLSNFDFINDDGSFCHFEDDRRGRDAYNEIY